MAGDRVIVIDVGCARHGGDYSIERLIEEFKPTHLYGFDPAEKPQPRSRPGAILPTRKETVGGCEILTYSEAAWTHSGEIGFQVDGLGGHVDECGPLAPCFDLAGMLHTMTTVHSEVVLKIDAEGAEYELLEHLIEKGIDKRLKLAWVEWHPPGLPVNGQPDARRDAIEERIGCELAQWNF